MTAGVYLLLNTVTGKPYIGSTVDLVFREKQHFSGLRNNSHANRKLANSWALHGEGAFKFTPLLICAKKDLEFYEQRAMDAYDSVANGYNIVPKAKKGWALGMRHTDEARKKMAEKATGRVMSRESVEKSRLGNIGKITGRKGIPISPDIRAKISATLKTRAIPMPADHPFRSGWFKGQKMPPRSAEHCKSIAAAWTPKLRAKLSIARALFSDEQAKSFIARFRAGETASALAREAGCGLSTMHRIVTRRNYKHLEDQ